MRYEDKVCAMFTVYRLLFVGLVYAVFCLNAFPQFQHDADSPSYPVVGAAKSGVVFCAVACKGPKNAYDLTAVCLTHAALELENNSKRVREDRVAWLGYRIQFLPWHFGYGCFWISEGENGESPLYPENGERIPLGDLPYCDRAGFDNDRQYEEFWQKKYGKVWGHAHNWNLFAPVRDARLRGCRNRPESNEQLPTGTYYHDTLPIADHRVQAVTLTDSVLTAWHGELAGPLGAPASRIKWTILGKEGKAEFHEPFILFACKPDLALVTKSGKAYRVKLPTDDKTPVRLDPLWLSVSRPIEAIITDVDHEISYGFAARPEAERGVYFPLQDAQRRTAYERPEAGAEATRVRAFARILLKDGKLKAK
jgi:hypothetical protein